jgi:hypothetical protein
VPGAARQSPDIAALGDPRTGVVLVFEGLTFAGIGGTSLACPIFSAMWAIADQAAGKSVGQAAPLNDAVSVGSGTNSETRFWTFFHLFPPARESSSSKASVYNAARPCSSWRRSPCISQHWFVKYT